ncbi:glycosyltransferase involved in cell wall biosynthesis [Crossiella equi]|uniref:Glycosyltransferase involved in cell wall biosynthesis n=1 Tax=Crossiella equi TaxID=130796 RepID=A0ABS5ALT0_9PSEU|nr:glycosyltransferase [Crossiella equi]MBP2477357.1 glycosyltransferase involved in cell wall biosynthesis [Crossiella equi]
MRIAMITDPAMSDQEPQVTRLAAGLTSAGHQVAVYTRSDRESLPMAEFSSFLAGRFRSQHPDLVHAHSWTAGLAALLASRDRRLPLVQTYHGLGTRGGDRNTVERLLAREASLVLAGDSEEQDRLVRMGVPRTRVSVVPRGIDRERFRPEGDRAPRQDGHRLLWLGSLTPGHGLERVVEVLPAVPDAELLIGAPYQRSTVDESERRALCALAERLGVRGRVRVLGSVAGPRLAPLLRSADALLCLPREEPHGALPLAAMACGTAVVASPDGELGDTVVPGVTGLHVPADDPKGLAKALRAFLADPAMVESCGAAGRDRVDACYSWDRVIADTDRLYLKVLADNLVPAPRGGS